MTFLEKWEWIINNVGDYDWLYENIELSDLGSSFEDFLEDAKTDPKGGNASDLVDIYEQVFGEDYGN